MRIVSSSETRENAEKSVCKLPIIEDLLPGSDTFCYGADKVSAYSRDNASSILPLIALPHTTL